MRNWREAGDNSLRGKPICGIDDFFAKGLQKQNVFSIFVVYLFMGSPITPSQRRNLLSPEKQQPNHSTVVLVPFL
jgi:hypothetical protein